MTSRTLITADSNGVPCHFNRAVVLEALRAARHELTCVHGLVATDRPDLWDRGLAWEIDVKPVLGLLDAALIGFADSDSEA